MINYVLVFVTCGLMIAAIYDMIADVKNLLSLSKNPIRK
jgi:hypothetical protein